jgi:propanol-preferring alcohol dehydrogenase
MVLEKSRQPLKAADIPVPKPGQGEVLIGVHACAVCRTDLHIVEGELPAPKLPLVPGHEIVGVVHQLGEGVERFQIGDRVGVPWLGWTCGMCEYCVSGRENLCVRARFTGYTRDGGYAEQLVADQRFCFPVDGPWSDAEASPLLCAGLIGYRSFRKAGDARRIGIYGFGAAAHIITQVARFEGREIYAFTRAGDSQGQSFAKSLGAIWAGGSNTLPPEKLDAAIIFAPVGALVPQALKALAPGGVVVCGGIHMSDIPSFAYELLWQERSLCSVANLTRNDGEEFLPLAARVPVKTAVQIYPLERANAALEDLRAGRVKGAAILAI